MITLEKHNGIILEPSKSYDAGASTFGCLFKEPDDNCHYLYYTCSTDVRWSKASIGVARSRDGINFLKYAENPIISIGKESVTPALFKAKGKYWMAFDFKPDITHGRKIGIAVA